MEDADLKMLDGLGFADPHLKRVSAYPGRNIFEVIIGPDETIDYQAIDAQLDPYGWQTWQVTIEPYADTYGVYAKRFWIESFKHRFPERQ
jgi:hypothetical protein